MSNDVRQRLMQQIREWNINRLDLFALSEPNQVLDVPKGRHAVLKSSSMTSIPVSIMSMTNQFSLRDSLEIVDL